MHDTDLTAERGMSLAQQRVLDAGHIFRRQQESDFGIDVQIEIKESAKATGRLIAAQIKAGPSYFKDGNDAEFWHYVSARHRDLWLNHSLPVILILCDLERGTCHYALVSEETCVKAGERWKVRVPKSSLISADSAVELASIASPIVAASDFSIMAEHDQSHGLARRISLDIVVHPGPKPINKPLLGAIIRAGLKHGQSSRYFRDEIARKTHEKRPVDVVCGFVYLREVDHASASWACRFQWISSGLSTRWRPLAFPGEPDGSGLLIDWAGLAELPKLLDGMRTTKAEYLEAVDVLLDQLPRVRARLADVICDGEASEASSGFAILARNFEASWDGSFSAPNECRRLDQSIQSLLATVSNSGLVWQQRGKGGRSDKQTQGLMKTYAEDLTTLANDIAFLRRDLR